MGHFKISETHNIKAWNMQTLHGQTNRSLYYLYISTPTKIVRMRAASMYEVSYSLRRAAG